MKVDLESIEERFKEHRIFPSDIRWLIAQVREYEELKKSLEKVKKPVDI